MSDALAAGVIVVAVWTAVAWWHRRQRVARAVERWHRLTHH